MPIYNMCLRAHWGRFSTVRTALGRPIHAKRRAKIACKNRMRKKKRSFSLKNVTFRLKFAIFYYRNAKICKKIFQLSARNRRFL